ncbi:MAG: BamA/TamA family outer membrane protein [Chitinophagales bacterium]
MRLFLNLSKQGLFCALVALHALLFISESTRAQNAPDSKKDTAQVKKHDSTGFDRFNKKAEALFKIIPVPIYSYSTDAGNIFGLAKFNLIHLSKKDTISKPSKLSEVFTVSTKGRINASVSTELVFHENKYVIISYLNYKKQPDYIAGFSNSLSRDSVTQVEYDRIKVVATGLYLVAKNLYVGIGVDFNHYFSVTADSGSFVKNNNALGLAAGWCNGAGIAIAYDSRDNRYNAHHGTYIIGTSLFYGNWLGSAYTFSKYILDARHFIEPWPKLKHVLAMQVTTTFADGNAPFMEYAQLGGDNQMRGYYQGALRDNVLLDGQVEYRVPVWNIFGAVAWVGCGQVQNSYSNLMLNQFHITYGAGLRIRVDTKNNTNMRFDMGFGSKGIQAFYINFAEAF